MLNLHSTHYAKLYPQNGERIVTTDSVTSFHAMYTWDIPNHTAANQVVTLTHAWPMNVTGSTSRRPVQFKCCEQTYIVHARPSAGWSTRFVVNDYPQLSTQLPTRTLTRTNDDVDLHRDAEKKEPIFFCVHVFNTWQKLEIFCTYTIRLRKVDL